MSPMTRRSIRARASRSRRPSAASTRSPKAAATTAASSVFPMRLKIAVDMAAKAYERDGSLSGIATGLVDLDRYMGGLQASDLVILAGRPGMGKTALATNIAFNIAKAHRSQVRADGTSRDGQRRHRRLLLARNVVRTIGDAHHRRAIGRAFLQDPSRRHYRTGFSPRRRSGARHAVDPVLSSTRPAAYRSPSSPRARGG